MRAAGTGDASALRVDEIAGARLATRHLLLLGHTAIGHIAGPADWVEAEGRMQGCVDELRDHGLELSASAQGDWTADYGYAPGHRLLQRGRSPRTSAATTRSRSA